MATMRLLVFSSIPDILSKAQFPLKIDRRVIVQNMQDIRDLTKSTISQIHNSCSVIRFKRNERISTSVHDKPKTEVLKKALCTDNIKCSMQPTASFSFIQAQPSITINVPAIHMAHKINRDLGSDAYLCLMRNNAISCNSINQFLRGDCKARCFLANTIASCSCILAYWMIGLESLAEFLYMSYIGNTQAHSQVYSITSKTNPTISQQKANPVRSLFIQWLIEVGMIAVIGAVRFCCILSSCYIACDKQMPYSSPTHTIGFTRAT